MAYEHALSEYDKVIGPALSEDQLEEYETSRTEYESLLNEGGATVPSARLEAVRSRYERLLEGYSRAIERITEITLSENGEATRLYEEARQAHEEAVRAYEEAERRYEEHYKPYEEAVAAAERAYEEKRRERVKVVEEVREQLEKAPDLYQQLFNEVLEKYQQTCAEEREKVVAASGLHILGTERHEARRIDNQLRGRAGRQGDPGTSRFYLSLEDDLLRIFGAERIQKIMDRLGMEEGEPIEHGLVTRAIENAQKRVESHNFDIRKHLLEYDDVMNKQREIVYGMRRQILDGASQVDTIAEWIEDMVPATLDGFAPPDAHPEEWDVAGLNEALFQQFDVRVPAARYLEATSREGLGQLVGEAVQERYRERERELGPDLLRALERHEMLIVIDQQWKDHLLSIDHLKEGIGLRGYGQRDPLTEYKREAFDLFQDMSERV